MRLYEFRNNDRTIDVTVTTDGSGEQKRVFITTTPTGPGYSKAGPTTGKPSIQAFGFPFVAGTEVDHQDFISFAERSGLDLIQWNEGLGDKDHVYTLTVTPTTLSFDKQGGKKGLDIVSTKQKLVKGIPAGVPIPVSVVVHVISGGSVFSAKGSEVTAKVNSGPSTLSGIAKVLQIESGKRVDVTLSQAGA